MSDRSVARSASLSAPVASIRCRKVGAIRGKARAERFANRRHGFERQRIEEPLRQRQEQPRFLGECERRVLRLAERRADAPAVLDRRLGARVDHGAEAGEDLELEELRVGEAEVLGEVLQDRRLRLGADARDAEADIHRRLVPLVEELRLQIDLPVGDGDEVGRDIGGEIPGLRLGDGQRGERAAAFRLRELRRALKQPRVHVEDVAGIGLASGRMAQ